MNTGAKRSLGPLPVHQPRYVGKSLMSNHRLGGEEGPYAAANGAHQDKSKLDWATEILAAVIRKAGENPDAPFTIEALQAAAIVEKQELTTFLRYRRNLKQRRATYPSWSWTKGCAGSKLGCGQQREPRWRHTPLAPAPVKAGSSSCPNPNRGRRRWMARSCWMNYPRPFPGTWSWQLRRCTRLRCGCSLLIYWTPLRPARAWRSPHRKSAAARPLCCHCCIS